MSDPQAGAAPAEAKYLVIGVFEDEEQAAGVLVAAVEARKRAEIVLEETAVLRKADSGAVSIREQNDLGYVASAGAGAVVGGLLGALFGRSGLGAVLGGAMGAGAAHVVDAGIPDARLRELADALQKDTSAFAAIVGESALERVRGFLEAQGGRVTVEPIAAAVTVTIPRTGIEAIDSLAQQAGEAAKPWAQQAADAMGGASATAEDLAQKAADEAKKLFGA